jgi:hypothetical protein
MLEQNKILKMKTLKINKLILLFLSLVVITSCVQDDDFDTPNLTFEEPNISANQLRTLGSLAGDLAQEQDNGGVLDYDDESTIVSYTFNENDEYISGYVVSSDEAGNYFEELIIQDNFENPTIGIKILIDVNPLFTKYEVGRKVFIKINGLAVGISNGVLAIGALNGTEVDKIASASETQVIQRSNEVATIVPLPLSISDFTNDKTNLMIGLSDVQFNRDEVINNSLTYASEQSDEFDGERTLESCGSSASVIFSTSTFSDFKGISLPSGRGSMNAVLTKDFFGEVFNVAINTPEDIMFTNTERCDPIELACGLAETTGANNLFADDFESQSTNSLVSGNGWTNFIEAGSEGWEAYTQAGTNSSQGVSARVGSFNSGDTSTVAWLITPQIDLDANTGVTLNFETSNSFSDGSNMEILFSNDWDGTEAGITSATWGIVSDAYVTQDGDFFGDWFESGNVDLSCGSGQIYIAFKYTGSGNSDFDGTYELDFVSIDAQ